MSLPFFRTWDDRIVSYTGVVMDRSAALALMQAYDALFSGGAPANPWPPFLDQARTAAQREELRHHLAGLGWT